MTLSWDKIRQKISSLRDLTLIGFANILTTAISGIFWLFMAQILATEEYGEVTYLISIASIAGTISALGSGSTLIVYRAKEVKLQATIYSLVLGSAAITSILLYFIVYNVGTSVYVIGYVIFTLAISELLGAKLYSDYSKYLITQRILVIVFALLFYYIIGPQGIVLGFGLSFFPYFPSLSVRKIKVKEFKIWIGVKILSCWKHCVRIKKIPKPFCLLIRSI